MKLFQKNELKVLWPFYLDSLISPILYFAPAFMIPYFLTLNFTLFQIGLLVAALPLFALIFEIPTGAIADIYGRKFSVLTGYFLEGIGYFSIFFFTDFYQIFLAFAFIGFGSTFSSGSKEAWITDLIKNKKGNYLHDFFVKAQTFDSFGLIISGLIGAIIVANFGMRIIWLFPFISFMASISILLFAEEYFIKRKIKIRDSFNNLKKQIKTSINYTRKHHVLYYFFIAITILAFAMEFNAGITWTPFLIELGFPDYAFGYLWSAIATAVMISPWLSKKFLKKNKERKFIISVLIISSLITLLVLWANNLIFALMVTIASLFFYTSRIPVERIYFHKFLPNKLRATIGSIESMLISISVIIGFPLAGFAVDLIGARYAIALTTLLMIPGIIAYMMIKEEK